MEDLLEKAVKKITDESNANMQGGYTDHHMSPYQRRMQLEPMVGKELETFNKVIRKLEREYGKEQSLRDLIDYGMDDGFFEVDKKGMLRLAVEESE